MVTGIRMAMSSRRKAHFLANLNRHDSAERFSVLGDCWASLASLFVNLLSAASSASGGLVQSV